MRFIAICDAQIVHTARFGVRNPRDFVSNTHKTPRGMVKVY
jgi:hypothetical protein